MHLFHSRNFKLLSFGAEAEEDEEEFNKLNEQFSGKSKSSHDVLGVCILCKLVWHINQPEYKF